MSTINLDEYSKENIEKEIRQRIIRKFGENHNIKLVLFKAESNYDDEYNNWSSNIIIIDNDFNEIQHNLNIPMPDDQYESDYYDETDDQLEIEDITIKF